MLSVLSQQNLVSSKPRTVSSDTISSVGNTLGECRYPIDKVSVPSSSRANGQNISSLGNSLDDILLHPSLETRLFVLVMIQRMTFYPNNLLKEREES